MYKGRIIMFLAVITMVLCAGALTYANTDTVFGDADSNGSITSNDAAQILQKVLDSIFEIPLQRVADNFFSYVDVDCSGDLTSTDSAYVMQKNLLSGFVMPCERAGTTEITTEQTTEATTSSELMVKMTVDGRTRTLTLYNNSTSRAFVEKLPITLPMMNLYEREMCYRFDAALPTDKEEYTGYEVGEIVYWPPGHSFVIMYEQNGEEFDMQKVGYVNGDVSFFKNSGTVNVTFERIN